MQRKTLTVLGGTVLLISGMAVAAEITGYLVDSRGEPVRSGSGSCLRTGSWSAQNPGAGCDSSPDRIVLLPGPDGNSGAVVIRGAAGEKLLDTPYAGVEVSKGGGIVARSEDATSVKTRYGVLLAAQPPRPVSFTVNFATGSASELTPESKPVIEAMTAELATRPAPEITVIGHTDRVGNAEANDKLSATRAETVKAILISTGVKAVTLDAAGRGERDPLVPTADDIAEPKNRRVEISIR